MAHSYRNCPSARPVVVLLLALAATGPACGAEIAAGEKAGETLTAALGMPLRWCPPGSFRMGSTEHERPGQGDARPVAVQLTRGFWVVAVIVGNSLRELPDFAERNPHSKARTATTGFWIGQSEVTQREWAAVMKRGLSNEIEARDDPFALLRRLAASDRVRQVFVRHAFRYWMGRNETLADAPTLIAADQAYVASGGSFRALLVSLLMSNSFLYCFAPEQAEQPVAEQAAADSEIKTSVRQITFGPQHHFYGYIGHVRNTPWNESGRYLVALRTTFQDRMPRADEAADIVLLDAKHDYAVKVIEQTRAWNPQQGTMLYWNPLAAETQFFFNDRDPKTQEVFCVLYDIAQQKRIEEYRYKDAAIGNSGVAQRGGWFLGINYGRLARLRAVTGYAGAHDWTAQAKGHSVDDGVFKINAKTGEKQLLVSFAQLAKLLREQHPTIDQKQLFINHTLWSRDDSRIFFFVRGDWGKSGLHFNVPMVMNADGSNLRPLAKHIGGHPEWESGRVLIGRMGNKQVRFDVEEQRVVGQLGAPEIFPDPEGDIALSPDGRWLVNGHNVKSKNYYTFLRLADGAWTRTAALDRGPYVSGDLRIDPAPCWNRDGTQVAVTALDTKQTRQMFIISVQPSNTQEQ